jgi:hypothetical protein
MVLQGQYNAICCTRRRRRGRGRGALCMAEPAETARANRKLIVNWLLVAFGFYLVAVAGR